MVELEVLDFSSNILCGSGKSSNKALSSGEMDAERMEQLHVDQQDQMSVHMLH